MKHHLGRMRSKEDREDRRALGTEDQTVQQGESEVKPHVRQPLLTDFLVVATHRTRVGPSFTHPPIDNLQPLDTIPCALPAFVQTSHPHLNDATHMPPVRPEV